MRDTHANGNLPPTVFFAAWAHNRSQLGFPQEGGRWGKMQEPHRTGSKPTTGVYTLVELKGATTLHWVARAYALAPWTRGIAGAYTPAMAKNATMACCLARQHLHGAAWACQGVRPCMAAALLDESTGSIGAGSCALGGQPGRTAPRVAPHPTSRLQQCLGPARVYTLAHKTDCPNAAKEGALARGVTTGWLGPGLGPAGLGPAGLATGPVCWVALVGVATKGVGLGKGGPLLAG